MPQTIAIIGAGPLGRWLALEAARAGYAVFLEDVMPSNLHHAKEELRRELGPEALSGAAVSHSNAPTSGAVPGRVVLVSTVEDAVREADLAIDCVPDELESKLEIFCLLDRMAPPRTVLATPTTRLSIADLASCTYRADRCMAIVAEAADLARSESREVLLRTTSKTSVEAADRVRSFWMRLGFAVRIEPDPAE